MRFLIVGLILLVTSCASIKENGDICFDKNKCELYVPVYTPIKMFIKGF